MDFDMKRFMFVDFEFVLWLEFENKEFKKQYNEVKGLYEKVCVYEDFEFENFIGN